MWWPSGISGRNDFRNLNLHIAMMSPTKFLFNPKYEHNFVTDGQTDRWMEGQTDTLRGGGDNMSLYPKGGGGRT